MLENCYLCSNAIFMTMTVSTSFGFITFPICEKHYSEAESDIHIAVEVMKKVIEESGRELPISIDEVPGILEKAGLYK